MFRWPRTTINAMPTVAPTSAASRMIGSSICQPSQAPSHSSGNLSKLGNRRCA
jgi:hypothetical protein